MLLPTSLSTTLSNLVKPARDGLQATLEKTLNIKLSDTSADAIVAACCLSLFSAATAYVMWRNKLLSPALARLTSAIGGNAKPSQAMLQAEYPKAMSVTLIKKTCKVQPPKPHQLPKPDKDGKVWWPRLPVYTCTYKLPKTHPVSG